MTQLTTTVAFWFLSFFFAVALLRQEWLPVKFYRCFSISIISVLCLTSPKISVTFWFRSDSLSNRFNYFPLDALSCSMANCQYGCDVLKGEVRCRCPSPGLQLGPDGRTCIGRWSDAHFFFFHFFSQDCFQPYPKCISRVYQVYFWKHYSCSLKTLLIRIGITKVKVSAHSQYREFNLGSCLLSFLRNCENSKLNSGICTVWSEIHCSHILEHGRGARG